MLKLQDLDFFGVCQIKMRVLMSCVDFLVEFELSVAFDELQLKLQLIKCVTQKRFTQ